jgi:hypothetical protein
MITLKKCRAVAMQIWYSESVVATMSMGRLSVRLRAPIKQVAPFQTICEAELRLLLGDAGSI